MAKNRKAFSPAVDPDLESLTSRVASVSNTPISDNSDSGSTPPSRRRRLSSGVVDQTLSGDQTPAVAALNKPRLKSSKVSQKIGVSGFIRGDIILGQRIDNFSNELGIKPNILVHKIRLIADDMLNGKVELDPTTLSFTAKSNFESPQPEIIGRFNKKISTDLALHVCSLSGDPLQISASRSYAAVLSALFPIALDRLQDDLST